MKVFLSYNGHLALAGQAGTITDACVKWGISRDQVKTVTLQTWKPKRRQRAFLIDIKVRYHLSHNDHRYHMGFLGTGGGHEVFSYELSDDIPHCSECKFQYNMKLVAPCFDCNGNALCENGRSYLQEKTWI
jgi:hypothetical protein